MAQTQRSRAADPAAEVVFSGKEIAAEDSQTRRRAQVLDELGHHLRPRRDERIEGAPRRAVPSWHRWAAAERWLP
jgi:hypothetical protein